MNTGSLVNSCNVAAIEVSHADCQRLTVIVEGVPCLKGKPINTFAPQMELRSHAIKF